MTSSAKDAPIRRIIDTPSGPAWADLRVPARPTGLLMIGHGAGGSVDAPDIAAVCRAILEAGIAVAAVTQPYRAAGKRAPAPAPRLDAAWLAVRDALALDPLLRVPRRRDLRIIAAGRSSGARVACRTAAQVGAIGVIALAFPLHPPGKPEATRQSELDGAGVPVLVVQGDRDPFGQPARDESRSREVLLIERADHGLKRELPLIAERCALFATQLLTAR